MLVSTYDLEWPAKFSAIRAVLAPALGDACSAIEHVGSTAVPGMVAKPIIDIIVVVPSSSLPQAIARLQDIGYVHKGDLGISSREAFELVSSEPRAALPAHHLYVCEEASEELLRQRAFRDYLIGNSQEAERLSRLKWALASRCGSDRQAYIAGKSETVREITRSALKALVASAPGH